MIQQKAYFELIFLNFKKAFALIVPNCLVILGNIGGFDEEISFFGSFFGFCGK